MVLWYSSKSTQAHEFIGDVFPYISMQLCCYNNMISALVFCAFMFTLENVQTSPAGRCFSVFLSFFFFFNRENFERCISSCLACG